MFLKKITISCLVEKLVYLRLLQNGYDGLSRRRQIGIGAEKEVVDKGIHLLHREHLTSNDCCAAGHDESKSVTHLMLHAGILFLGSLEHECQYRYGIHLTKVSRNRLNGVRSSAKVAYVKAHQRKVLRDMLQDDAVRWGYGQYLGEQQTLTAGRLVFHLVHILII